MRHGRRSGAIGGGDRCYDGRVLSSYDIAFHHASPLGVLSAVHLPDGPDPVPEAQLSRLHPAEAEFSRSLRGYRQVQFVGGRLALRSACEQVGVRPGPILSDDRGAPSLPSGLVGSVSHKRTIAVGMVAHPRDGTLGVDVEEYEPARLGIGRRVLTPTEQEDIAALPDPRRWMATLMRFSIKESIYKALDPYVRRYVGFHEAEVTPDLHGAAAVRLLLVEREGPFVVDARYHWLHGYLLTSVRIRPEPT